jgi:glycerol-3-phosphate cytidylyltransferase-like family protein
MMDDFSKAKLIEALEAVRDAIKDLEERVIALEKLAAIHADILFHGDDKLQDLENDRYVNWLADNPEKL